MSEVTPGVPMKTSISDVELVSENQPSIRNSDSGSSFPTVNVSLNDSNKLKRSFTFTRNAFNGSRMSKRRSKHRDSNKDNSSNNSSMVISDMENLDSNQNQNRKLFRKPSWNKFFNKFIQKVSTLGVNNNKNLCSSYVYNNRRRTPISLSSNDIRVPPTRLVNFSSGDKVPGVIGLRNHGNTCFINAVLQCLSHTDILAEYFVLDQYKVDLSRRNKLNSKKYGTKGEVTEQLAVLLKSIWSCQYDPEISNKFKLVVDKYGSQYRGNNQHDAQEFLLWLLDKVHEDLNTATKKKYKVIKNSFGRPDDIVAAETLANHVRCNNSFVHAVFQAQFRSSLTCPHCERQSNTFDPFLCVSVPVPHDHFTPVFVTVVHTEQTPRQYKIGLSLPVDAEIRELREALASDTKIAAPHMLITEIDDLGFHRTFADNQPVNVIKENEPIYCLQLPQLKETTADSGEYILLCWVNVLMLEDQCARFSSPFTVQMCRETSYVDVQKLLLKEMAWTLDADVLTSEQPAPLFRVRVCDAGGATCVADHTYLDPSLDHPLYAEAVDQALAMCDPAAGQPHVKLVLEWDLAAKESTIADDSDIVEEHFTVQQLRSTMEQGGSVTLEECFELYTRAEVLGAEDAWHCPNCNLKQKVVKKLGLWTLPDILVIHLKRFRHSSTAKIQAPLRSPTKLTALVEFPVFGFDMSPHVSAGGVQGGGGGQVEGGGGVWSHWRRPPPPQPPPPPPHSNHYIYDLYAVCNHHGHDLQGGHYTAYCRNPYDAQWYCFDDTKVVPISESSLVTASAYILFYQRRGLLSPSSSSSSSCSGPEHWAARLLPPTPEELANADNNSEDKKFDRNSRAYSTLQPSTKRPIIIDTNEKSESKDVKNEDEPASETTAPEKPNETEEKVEEVELQSKLEKMANASSSPIVHIDDDVEDESVVNHQELSESRV
ncbi:hypothetical protein LSTR_LSTR002624 [Laodelphax striatellus]|uniref:Ubiquitin carboxyl-terminal hydrolase n=1 Tax=Laodelphax striatellus TaxID=195883 RepID=A0A482XND5_LAOST|nr:hypothetical protein LSTR_LSTR002624 [Laodelphax striatellus]